MRESMRRSCRPGARGRFATSGPLGENPPASWRPEFWFRTAPPHPSYARLSETLRKVALRVTKLPLYTHTRTFQVPSMPGSP